MSRRDRQPHHSPQPPPHRINEGAPREVFVGADPAGSPPAGAFERVAVEQRHGVGPRGTVEAIGAPPGFEALGRGGRPIEPGSTIGMGEPLIITRSAPWWNNISRAWFVTSPGGHVMRLDPQPPSPQAFFAAVDARFPEGRAVLPAGSLTEAAAIVRETAPEVRRHFTEAHVPPSVKVSA